MHKRKARTVVGEVRVHGAARDARRDEQRGVLAGEQRVELELEERLELRSKFGSHTSRRRPSSRRVVHERTNERFGSIFLQRVTMIASFQSCGAFSVSHTCEINWWNYFSKAVPPRFIFSSGAQENQRQYAYNA